MAFACLASSREKAVKIQTFSVRKAGFGHATPDLAAIKTQRTHWSPSECAFYAQITIKTLCLNKGGEKNEEGTREAGMEC